MLEKEYFRDEIAAHAKLESIVWPNGPVCPHCGGRERIIKIGGAAALKSRHHCYSCRLNFRASMGTVFGNSNLPLHVWFRAIFLIAATKAGAYPHLLFRTLGIADANAANLCCTVHAILGTQPPPARRERASHQQRPGTPGHHRPRPYREFVEAATALGYDPDSDVFERALARICAWEPPGNTRIRPVIAREVAE